jgi:LmbE family N-acetylglucosaminyl deacetylase
VKVLAVSAHADDETLGCGGTLLRHRQRDDDIAWLVISEPSSGARWSDEARARKSAELERVAAAYGARDVIRLSHPAGRLDTVPVVELNGGIAQAIRRTRPEVVYLMHAGDAHTDHAAAFRAAMSVLKPSHLRELGVRQVLSYETLSSTEAAATPSFAPNLHVDISAWVDRKIEVMEMYESEIHPEPLPRSPSAIRALARYRGATVGLEYAEAFVLVHGLDA